MSDETTGGPVEPVEPVGAMPPDPAMDSAPGTEDAPASAADSAAPTVAPAEPVVADMSMVSDAGPVVSDAEPADAVVVDSGATAGRLVLGLLLALLIGAVAVVVWAVLYVKVERDYVGVTVLAGLVIGYALRAVSRRGSIPVRLLAVLVTALVAVAGTVVGFTAYHAHVLRTLGFWDDLGKQLPHTTTLLKHRTGLQYVVMVAGLVIAFLAASPSKPKPVRATDAPAEPAVPETD